MSYGKRRHRCLLIFWLVWVCCASVPDARAGQPMAFIADREIHDSVGRRIHVKKAFTRIISLYPAHTENLFALGLDREIIGVSPTDDYPEKTEKKARFSYRFDPERFLAAGPDLVLVRPMVDRAYPHLLSLLEKQGITVASLQPSGVKQLGIYWQILGALTGKRERSRLMVTDFFGQVEVWRRWSDGIQSKKQVYFEAIHSKMKTFSPQSMAIFVLETAGGGNAAFDASPVRGTNIAFFGKERLLARAGKIDVYLAQSGAMNRPTVEMLVQEPGYSVINAIQNREVYIVDEARVSRPTVRLLEGIRQIAGILYPDRPAPAIRHAFSRIAP